MAHGKKILVTGHKKDTDHVDAPDAAVLVSVEIKERGLTFTSPDDYPYETVFVDDARGLGLEKTKPLAYIFVSKATGKWVWLSPLDRGDDWEIQSVYDKGRGHSFDMLVAPKKYLRPAEAFTAFTLPHGLLEYVDGDTGAFRHGGGETETRERGVETANKTSPKRTKGIKG